MQTFVRTLPGHACSMFVAGCPHHRPLVAQPLPSAIRGVSSTYQAATYPAGVVTEPLLDGGDGIDLDQEVGVRKRLNTEQRADREVVWQHVPAPQCSKRRPLPSLV